jgi:hypothetical protein
MDLAVVVVSTGRGELLAGTLRALRAATPAPVPTASLLYVDRRPTGELDGEAREAALAGTYRFDRMLQADARQGEWMAVHSALAAAFETAPAAVLLTAGVQSCHDHLTWTWEMLRRFQHDPRVLAVNPHNQDRFGSAADFRGALGRYAGEALRSDRHRLLGAGLWKDRFLAVSRPADSVAGWAHAWYEGQPPHAPRWAAVVRPAVSRVRDADFGPLEAWQSVHDNPFHSDLLPPGPPDAYGPVASPPGPDEPVCPPDLVERWADFVRGTRGAAWVWADECGDLSGRLLAGPGPPVALAGTWPERFGVDTYKRVRDNLVLAGAAGRARVRHFTSPADALGATADLALAAFATTGPAGPWYKKVHAGGVVLDCPDGTWRFQTVPG